MQVDRSEQPHLRVLRGARTGHGILQLPGEREGVHGHGPLLHVDARLHQVDVRREVDVPREQLLELHVAVGRRQARTVTCVPAEPAHGADLPESPDTVTPPRAQRNPWAERTSGPRLGRHHHGIERERLGPVALHLEGPGEHAAHRMELAGGQAQEVGALDRDRRVAPLALGRAVSIVQTPSAMCTA